MAGNPILAALNAMAPGVQRGNNMLSRLIEVKQMLGGQGAEATFNRMMRENPQFAQFAKQCQGKSTEQIAQENGLDLNLIRQIFG